jgi:nucleoid DNA-binding protein
VSDVGECKKCGARITRSTTFCRSCNTVFPEFVEISEDTPSSEKDKASEEKKSPSGSGLSYAPLGSSQEKETKKPDPSPPSGSEPSPDSVQEPTGDPEPQPVLPEEQAQQPEVEPEPKPEVEPEPVEEPEKPEHQEPEPTHQDEPARPAERKERPKETVGGKKSTTGEFAVFQDPKLLQPASNLKLSESGKKFSSSAEVIAELASETSRSPEEVAGVVDGFWDYVSDVRQHYKEGVKHHYLPIPHFGTFRFQFKWKKGKFHPKLTFKSSTTISAKAHRRTYSSRWADQWSGDLEGLSIRRRISVYVTKRSGLPLSQADQIFNRLLRTARELCEGGGRIHWARRGTMGTFQVVDKKESSGRNMQTGERITVRTGRDSITGERIPADGNEHFSFSASKGFLKRLNLPDPPNEPRTNRFGASRQTGGQAKGTGCQGCLGILVVIIAVFLGWIIFIAFDSDEVEKTIETDAKSAPDTVNYSPFADRRAILKAHSIKSWNPSYPKSSSSHEKTRISFSNGLNLPVIVHWVDFQGSRKKFFEVKPQREIITNTYTRHVWLITDRNGKALMYFIARKVGNGRHGLASITSESTSSK